jgi:hypothetical protein
LRLDLFKFKISRAYEVASAIKVGSEGIHYPDMNNQDLIDYVVSHIQHHMYIVSPEHRNETEKREIERLAAVLVRDIKRELMTKFNKTEIEAEKLIERADVLTKLTTNTDNLFEPASTWVIRVLCACKEVETLKRMGRAVQ